MPTKIANIFDNEALRAQANEQAAAFFKADNYAQALKTYEAGQTKGRNFAVQAAYDFGNFVYKFFNSLTFFGYSKGTLGQAKIKDDQAKKQYSDLTKASKELAQSFVDQNRGADGVVVNKFTQSGSNSLALETSRKVATLARKIQAYNTARAEMATKLNYFATPGTLEQFLKFSKVSLINRPELCNLDLAMRSQIENMVDADFHNTMIDNFVAKATAATFTVDQYNNFVNSVKTSGAAPAGFDVEATVKAGLLNQFGGAVAVGNQIDAVVNSKAGKVDAVKAQKEAARDAAKNALAALDKDDAVRKANDAYADALSKKLEAYEALEAAVKATAAAKGIALPATTAADLVLGINISIPQEIRGEKAVVEAEAAYRKAAGEAATKRHAANDLNQKVFNILGDKAIYKKAYAEGDSDIQEEAIQVEVEVEVEDRTKPITRTQTRQGYMGAYDEVVTTYGTKKEKQMQDATRNIAVATGADLKAVDANNVLSVLEGHVQPAGIEKLVKDELNARIDALELVLPARPAVSKRLA